MQKDINYMSDTTVNLVLVIFGGGLFFWLATEWAYSKDFIPFLRKKKKNGE